MPSIFFSIAEENRKSVKEGLEETPNISFQSQFFTFLRCHDELTLELFSQSRKNQFLQFYLKDPKFIFRKGEGIFFYFLAFHFFI